MKKNIIISILLSLFLFVNCSKSEVPIDKSENQKATGDSANDLLSNSKFDKVILEIGYVTGFKPNSTAIADVTEFLTEITFKENFSIQYKELSSPGKETLSLQEIDDLESKNRTAYNSGNTLAIYIYFSDAPSADDIPEEDLVTLGAVYRNTSMVIYASTIRDLAGKSFLISEATVSTATMQHEFGHLLGLVNLGSNMVHVHEGTTTNDNGNEIPSQHCNQTDCLMRAELEFAGAMGKMLTSKNGQVPVLDTECLLDLKANGGR